MNDFNDFGLDLAVIGNGQTAALLEPASRLVWWCYPRFDGDPVFSRLLAGDEEKGFCDIVLDDMVDYSSDYERNTPVVSTVLTNSQNNAVVSVSTLASTRYRNAAGIDVSASTFFATIKPGQVVEAEGAKGTGNTLTATKLKLQN